MPAVDIPLIPILRDWLSGTVTVAQLALNAPLAHFPRTSTRSGFTCAAPLGVRGKSTDPLGANHQGFPKPFARRPPRSDLSL